MMIRAGRDNRDIMQCVQCSLNTMKAIRSELGEYSDDDEALAARKPHSQRRDCVRTDAFLTDLQARVMENPGIGIRPLAREMGVAPSTRKMAHAGHRREALDHESGQRQTVRVPAGFRSVPFSLQNDKVVGG